MWGPLLALGLLLTVNPVRLGIILLVLSRPRPMQNLLVYWAGTTVVGLAYLLIPLILLHSTPTSAALVRGMGQPTTSPTVQRIVIGIGALLLVFATIMATRSLKRTGGGGGAHRHAHSSTRPLDPTTLPVISQLARPAKAATAEATTGTQRLLASARNAWQNGSPWISLVIGLMVMPADGVIFALALIVASGDVLGAQIGAAVVFVVVVLLVEEVILVSNLLVPEKTEAALRWLRDWAIAHHRKFMAAIFAVVGVSLIIRGIGII